MAFLGLLVWMLIWMQGTRGSVEYRHEKTRLKRQTEPGGNNFTCPDFFGNESPDKIPASGLWQVPSFSSNCPPAGLQPTYYMAEGEDGAIVTWSEPVAMDWAGSGLRVVQVRGGASGSRFSGRVGGRRHDMVYLTTDSQGLSTNCYFSFTVNVMTCPKLPWPSNGHVQCSNDSLPGSACRYTCDDGYQLSGTSVVTCNNHSDPKWTRLPTCEKATCGAPSSVLHGSLICDGDSYLSYCTVSCDAGYTLEGSVFTKCQANGRWSAAKTPTCKDTTPPNIFCLSPQLLWADRAQNTALASWAEPTAVDDVDANPTVIKVSGLTQGASILAGTSRNMTYKAVDSEGNESPECTIKIRALAITCGHPRDVLADANLTFSCTLTSFTWGDQCTLDCDWNLPLEGSKILTCERNNTSAEPTGYWSWGTGDQPYCRHEACPSLDPPRNGRLDTSTINGLPAVHVICTTGSSGVIYVVPDMGTRFTGLILCHAGIGWSPYTRTPDCIVPRNVRGFKLDSEIYYFDGTCGQADLDAIKAEFQEKLNNATSLFQAVCPVNVTCAAGNPAVSCLQARRRRALGRNTRGTEWERVSGSRLGLEHSSRGRDTRRHALAKRQTTSDTLIISFDIDTFFDSSQLSSVQMYNYADEIQLNNLKPVVQSMVDDGGFDLPLWTLTGESFKTANYGDVTCDDGHHHDAGNVCKPCPIGYFLDNSVCVACPIGQYNNVSGAVSCTSCPDGSSTRHTSSEFVANCTRFCSPGTYSPDTFEPCAPCPRGSYQPDSGQTSCRSCPPARTTVWSASTSGDFCQDFDVRLGDTLGLQEAASIAAVTDLTVSVWMKKTGHKSPHVVLKLGDESSDVVAINVTDNVRVRSTWFPNLDGDIGSVLPDAWAHVTVAIDRQSKRAFVYLDEQLKSTAENPQLNDASSNGVRLCVSSDGETGVLLSGFRVQGTVASQAEVTGAMATCLSSGAVDLLHMGAFQGLNKPGISIISPSSCNVNHCRNSPCGSHKCVNGESGFTCICSNNWSGSTCTTPPDFCMDNACRNNGTCRNGVGNYSCDCTQGYTGYFCETTPVDGGWSTWSRWTECTATCDRGTRERKRACDSPEPGEYGQNCVDDAVETENCNTSPCPECPSSVLESANRVRCTTDVDAGLQCIVQCQDGYQLPGYLDSHRFRCGLATGYTWLPMSNIPDCGDTIMPLSVTLVFEIGYASEVPLTNEQEFKNSLQNNLKPTDCSNDGRCDIKVNILDGQTGDTFSRVGVYFVTPLMQRGVLDYAAYLTNGTVSTSLQELIDATTVLDSSATWITSPGVGVFDVFINGDTFTAEAGALAVYGAVTCGDGQVPAGCFCGQCPTGSFYDGTACRFCPRGRYQHQTGQAECLSCAQGYTTPSVGSRSHSDCSETMTPGSSSSTPATTKSATGSFSSTPATTKSATGSFSSTPATTKSATGSSSSTPATTKSATGSFISTPATTKSATGSFISTPATTKSATGSFSSTQATTKSAITITTTDNTAIFIGAAIAGLSLIISVATILVVVCRRRKGKARASTTNATRNPDRLSNLTSTDCRLSHGQAVRASNTYADIDDIAHHQEHYNMPQDTQTPPPYDEIPDRDVCRIDPAGRAYYYTINDASAPPPYKEVAGSDDPGDDIAKPWSRPLPTVPVRRQVNTSSGNDYISPGSMVGAKGDHGLAEDNDYLTPGDTVEARNHHGIAEDNEYLTPSGIVGALSQKGSHKGNEYVKAPGIMKSTGHQMLHTGNDYVMSAEKTGVKGKQTGPKSNDYLTPADVPSEETATTGRSEDYIRMDSASRERPGAERVTEQEYQTATYTKQTNGATALPEQEYITPSFLQTTGSLSRANLVDNDYLTKVVLYDVEKQ